MMTTQELTTHATRRCSQRGLKQSEIDQIFANADVEPKAVQTDVDRDEELESS